MHASQHEKLSLLIDDEIDNAQALSLLKSIQRDPILNAKLQRYALISQAFKGDSGTIAGLDFADKVKQQLKQEPIYLLPQKKSSPVIKTASWAVAASAVLAVVYLSTVQLEKQPKIDALAQRSIQSEEINAQFKEYLQAHDNVWHVNDNNGVQSYTRIASYQPK